MARTQIDLLYQLDDRVYIVCELKNLNWPVGKSVINDVEKKIETLKPGKYSILKVLIAPMGADAALKNTGYFGRIIELDQLYQMHQAI